MVKTATRSVDLEPIDRLEEKMKLLVGMVDRMRTEQARAAEENQRLSRELESMRARLATHDGIATELSAMKDERDVIRARVTDMLEQLEAQVIRITVTELKESTFYASITVQQNGSEVEIDSRPSDAIALAVRADAPIFAADDVIEESAIEFEGEEVNEDEIVDEFKKFLDDVSPDQFAVGDEEA